MKALEIAQRRGVRLSEAEASSIRNYELGTRLLSVTDQPGWKDVMALLREEVDRAQHKLTDSRLEDPNGVFQLHCRYLAMKDLIRVFEARVKALTESAGVIPAVIEQHHLT
jgi:hypothetical protein